MGGEVNAVGMPKDVETSYDCEGSTHRIELTDVIDTGAKTGQMLNIYQNGVLRKEDLDLWMGETYKVSGISVKTTDAVFVPGDLLNTKVSGEVICGSY